MTDSKKAILLPLFKANDPEYIISEEFKLRFEAEIKRLNEQQPIEPVKYYAQNAANNIDLSKYSKETMEEMNEISQLLYGTST